MFHKICPAHSKPHSVYTRQSYNNDALAFIHAHNSKSLQSATQWEGGEFVFSQDICRVSVSVCGAMWGQMHSSRAVQLWEGLWDSNLQLFNPILGGLGTPKEQDSDCYLVIMLNLLDKHLTSICSTCRLYWQGWSHFRSVCSQVYACCIWPCCHIMPDYIALPC